MTSKKNKGLKLKNIIFYGMVVIALAAIGYFSLNLNKGSKTESLQTVSSSNMESSDSEIIQSSAPIIDKTTNTPQETQLNKDKNVTQDANSQSNSVQTPYQVTSTKKINQNQPKNTPTKAQITQISSPKAESTVKNDNIAIKIAKNEVTGTAKFYPYKLDGLSMEVIAVKATDGTIRTALNTCQVCYDSGRGYYEQVGEYLVCQNCGNRFHIDQLEKVKGGCNPVPIFEENKRDTGGYINISKDFLTDQKEYFSKWKNN